MGKTILLSFQTLAVIFGDVGMSPLYTFIKYVLIVLWANDDGEGGNFTLYSFLCKYAKVHFLPNQLRLDAFISSFRLNVPSPQLERSLKIKERLEALVILKKLLLMLVLASTVMVIADGVITPAMSVVYAICGLKFGFSVVKQDEVVMISEADHKFSLVYKSMGQVKWVL
ncbi:putative CD2 antigen cytoplasmic tail-binding protein 2-like [Capsicum annuum]|nr:putative CD2 antigen cytoplasmic tail-binding protein 2-like [Capsicum annuum]KAF3665579.1 putative CD2 antigen cytoplasmic tail-binding protein 2-like [Capsicum annuum]